MSIKCRVLNIRSLSSRAVLVNDVTSDYHTDLFCVTETWLGPKECASAWFETRVASLRYQFLTNPAPNEAEHCGYKSLPLMIRRRYVEKQLSESQQWQTNTPVLLWVVKWEEKNLRAFIFFQRTWKSENNGWISFPEIIVVLWKFQIKRCRFAVTISRRTASLTLCKKRWVLPPYSKWSLMLCHQSFLGTLQANMLVNLLPYQ